MICQTWLVATLALAACASEPSAGAPDSLADAAAAPDSIMPGPDPAPDALADADPLPPPDLPDAPDVDVTPQETPTFRVATYNLSLFRDEAGQLRRDLEAGDAGAQGAAAVLRTVRPDIVLLNEFDVDLTGETLDIFCTRYLEAPRDDGLEPLVYPYRWVAPSNTGIPSGFDLNRDGRTGGPPGSRAWGDDSLGFGTFEGQYGFVVLSRYPIRTADIRTFQRLLWKDMPEARLPSDPATGGTGDWYSPEILEVFRLSSKNHADVVIELGPGRNLHFLVSHPTPPAFDGAERRNVLRNHDEVRFWRDYLDNAAWITDDAGRQGGLPPDARFVIAGDLNSDPNDPADGLHPVRLLLEHPRVIASPTPSSEGAVEASARTGQANAVHVGDPAHDTAAFNAATVGFLRVDYVLPSTPLQVRDARVFWPRRGEAGFDWVGDFPFPVSDHRLVWVDLAWP
jgi:endonuclease/exonuclease/phosphatase family metal-dependent hydrolase